jgi:hypothetical protein
MTDLANFEFQGAGLVAATGDLTQLTDFLKLTTL